MAGTREGGRNAAATNKAKYGENFYAQIGAIGGRNGTGGGFFQNRELARIAGAKGGKASKRGPHPEGCTCKVHTNGVPVRPTIHHEPVAYKGSAL